jgi:hypothetical protein
MNLEKIIKEVLNEGILKKSPHEYPNQKVINDIIDYLYNNDIYDIKKGIIKKYKQEDNIKILSIKIYGDNNGPYSGNKYLIYPYLYFDIISNKNGYNVENIVITGEENGYFKDLDKGEGYHIKLLKRFDKEFYTILKKEIINNFRFDNKIKFDPSKLEKSIDKKEDDVIRMEPSNIKYIESIAKLDSNEPRRKKILKLTDKVKKQNYYTKRSLLLYFEKYKRGEIR